MSADKDSLVRLRAFEFLREATRLHGDTLSWKLLLDGFAFEGQRVPLVSMQGIFKPRVLDDAPLSIRTSPKSAGEAPYADLLDDSGFLSYCYRESRQDHHENRWLRTACERHLPLIYLAGVAEGRYQPFWPAYVVRDDAMAKRFSVAIDDEMIEASPTDSRSDERRRYVTRQQLQRLHQRRFSLRVLAAYRQQCSVCRLRHVRLLDAAHILPDGHPRGDPVVQNGLALCKIHHAAFDCNIIGIRPDCVVEVRGDVLKEIDGPMLEHGLQRFHDHELLVPRDRGERPDPERLEERFELFRSAG